MKEILLNIESKEMRLALVKFGLLQDLIVERKKIQTDYRKYLSGKGNKHLTQYPICFH